MWTRAFFDRDRAPPTRAKHALLDGWFAAWLDHLGPTERARVLDGFAGAGRYGSRQQPGSPLILLGRAAALPTAGRLSFLLVERDAATHARLRNAVDEELRGAPAGGEVPSVQVVCGAFEDEAQRLLREPALPTFSFVDPYGYDGVTLPTVAALASRGAAVWHFAASALFTKLMGKSGAGPRQARRMDRLLGEEGVWARLRAQARPGEPSEQKAALARVATAALERSGLRAVAHPLREGESYLIYAAPLTSRQGPLPAS